MAGRRSAICAASRALSRSSKSLRPDSRTPIAGMELVEPVRGWRRWVELSDHSGDRLHRSKWGSLCKSL